GVLQMLHSTLTPSPNSRGPRIHCEALEGRLAPGDVLLSAALFRLNLGTSPAPFDRAGSTAAQSSTLPRTLPAAELPRTAPAEAGAPHETVPSSVGGVFGTGRNPFENTAAVLTGTLLSVVGAQPPTIQADYVLQEWDIPTPRSQPHDIITDEEGIAWFTEIAANKIGRFDPFKEQFLEFNLPTPNG